MPSKFFTNSSERNLFGKFTGIVDSMKDLYAFYAVVGYFRSSGYFKLQPYLKDLKEIKILVGINVDEMFAATQRKGLLFFGDEAKAKEEFLKDFIQDIREARYAKEVEDGIADFIRDLVDGRIEVRAHRSRAIHAKFYLFLPENRKVGRRFSESRSRIGSIKMAFHFVWLECVSGRRTSQEQLQMYPSTVRPSKYQRVPYTSDSKLRP